MRRASPRDRDVVEERARNWVATRTRWRWGLLALACALVAVTAIGLGGFPLAAARDTHASALYGADDARMQAAATAVGWPQQANNWCGVATIAAVAQYQGAVVTQGGIAGFLNSPSSVSEWGTPAYTYPGPGFAADISRDAGTDPRALAEGLSAEIGGTYRQLVDNWGAWDATYHLVADLEYTHQPISVIVDGGQHSVVVSAVHANGDPAVNGTGSIIDLHVWDPGVGFNAQIQPFRDQWVPLSNWLYDSVYWGSVYNSYLDPDPAVGPYAGTNLWTYHRVYIRPYGIAGVSASWALNQLNVVIPGAHGEYPPGYTPPTPTPTPTPTDTPTPLPVRLAHAAPTLAAAQSSLVAATDTAAPTVDATWVPPAATASPPAKQQAWCVGPYCVSVADLPWWAGSLACLLFLVGVWGAVLARARRADRAATASQRTSVPTLPLGPPGERDDALVSVVTRAVREPESSG